MSSFEPKLFATMACILRRNSKANEALQSEDGGGFQEILELDRELQIKEGSNVPQMSVKHGQVSYTTSYVMNILIEDEVQGHLDSVSSEEKKVIKRIMEMDRRFQDKLAKEFAQISVLSSAIVHIFNWTCTFKC